jgi:hypothetical protein
MLLYDISREEHELKNIKSPIKNSFESELRNGRMMFIFNFSYKESKSMHYWQTLATELPCNG